MMRLKQSVWLGVLSVTMVLVGLGVWHPVLADSPPELELGLEYIIDKLPACESAEQGEQAIDAQQSEPVTMNGCSAHRCEKLLKESIVKPVRFHFTHFYFQRWGKMTVGGLDWYFPLDNRTEVTDADLVKRIRAEHEASVKKMLEAMPDKTVNQYTQTCPEPCDCKLADTDSRQRRRVPRSVTKWVAYTPRPNEVLPGVEQFLIIDFHVKVRALQTLRRGRCEALAPEDIS